MVKQEMISGLFHGRLHLSSSRWTESQTVHAESRIISSSAQIHRRYQKHTYFTWCNEGEIFYDYWNADGDRALSDTWTGFTHYSLVHKFIPIPQAMQIPAAIAAVEKEWEKLEKIPAWQLTKVRNKKMRWSLKQGWRNKSAFCVVNGSLSCQEFGVGTTSSKIQRKSCAPRWHCERWFRIVCCIYRAGIISITNDGCKNHGYYIQTARVRRTSSRRRICLYSGQTWRDAPRLLKIPKSEWPCLYGFVYHDTNGQNHGPVWKTQSFLDNLRKSYCSTVGRQFPIGNAYSHTVKKSYSYLCMWMT